MSKIKNEAETRRGMIEAARILGCEGDLLQIFHKYDTMLKRCTNPIEREQISLEANTQVHYLNSKYPGLLQVGRHIIGRE